MANWQEYISFFGFCLWIENNNCRSLQTDFLLGICERSTRDDEALDLCAGPLKIPSLPNRMLSNYSEVLWRSL